MTTSNHSKRGGKFLPALCVSTGTLCLLLVFALLLPIPILRLFGFEAYHVVSCSMAPAIPEGSMVIVKRVSPLEIQAGDIIAFGKDRTVVTHRVISVNSLDGSFVTKGDANDEEDLAPTLFVNVIGRVEAHIPLFGALFTLFTDGSGKLYLFSLLGAGLLLRILGDSLKKKETEAKKDE